MKILHTTSEVTPIYKFGGLGDVSGSLTKSLSQLGHDVRIILPAHPQINLTNSVEICKLEITYDRRVYPVVIVLQTLPDSKIPVYLVSNNTYLSKDTKAAQNHADKYAFFSLAVAKFIKVYKWWQPDLIQLNDWHTSLIPVCAKHLFHLDHQKYVMTIHNLGYEGNTNTPVATKLHLPPKACQVMKWDTKDDYINLLLEGIIHADAINTVSPQYATEILSGAYSNQAADIINQRKDVFRGIINGIDTDAFNPQKDKLLKRQYSAKNALEGKRLNREVLLNEYFPDSDSDEILIGFVGRVDGEQKGIDTIIQLFKELEFTRKHGKWIFLGTGDPSLEKQLHQAADKNPYVEVITRFDEPLARLIYAASHLMLIPSSYEPCGLVQLIAQQYGAIPIANSTGGLIDTIKHQETGILTLSNNLNHTMEGIQDGYKLINSYSYGQIVSKIMNLDLSWNNPAKEYELFFQNVLNDNVFSPH